MRGKEPTPRPYGVSGPAALALCREWMVLLGAPETVVSNTEPPAPCDLYSGRYIAWVSDRRGNLEVDLVDRAAAVAASDGRVPLIFLPGGVRPMARERADELGVALLRYRANDAALDGANALGRQLRAGGLAIARR